MSALPASLASRGRWPLGRVATVLAVVLVLHLWAFDRARNELAFDLPPPTSTIQAELFRLPAQVAVNSKPADVPRPARPARPAAAISAPAPPAAVPIEPVPAPAAAPEVQQPAEAPATPAEPASDLPQESASPLDAVLVSFPRLGRFVSDTTYAKGLLRVLGTTTIEWKIGSDSYEANSVTLDDSGRTLLTLASRGGVRPAVGVAPERYTEQRLSRAPVATNFQWDARKLTFSASSAEFPLNDGVQDQLSFMAQLALLAQAFPDRFRPEAAIAMEVASTRSVRVYDFRVIGWEAIRTGTGVVDALKLDRVVAPGSRDARIELWLAPSLRWLPARTRTTLANQEVIETVLREVHLE